MAVLKFADVARLPLPGDNVAIVSRRLERGTRIETETGTLELNATVLEGHRFALVPIANREPVLSWNLPFGTAISDIQPGQYICNTDILKALSGRDIDVELPTQPNFESEIPPFELSERDFLPGSPTGLLAKPGTFKGFPRPAGRRTGTRNYIVLLGTSSLTGGFVRALEEVLRPAVAELQNVDGVVAVAHTEGAVPEPNNRETVLRTLAGYMVHPNTGAILAVDYGTEGITNSNLEDFLKANKYPLGQVPHGFQSIESSFSEALEVAAKTVKSWLPQVNAVSRQERPLSDLRIALQCGGSDAFSGISGNPLAAWVAREVIRHGGVANLAETDELIGAESYVLQSVKDWPTAQRFIEVSERFKARSARHGHSAEGNPSGGNKFRGLYNIFLKSIGAAMKRNPDVRLDGVLEYGELLPGPGYYFMDSPGNDLESIAGQVATGCNLIFFVTGNGSITNFPFVPTLKIVTTTDRYELLQKDMDVNAGLYLDGTDMEALGRSFFDLTLKVAEGQRTLGEQAGHSQIQLWRNWDLEAGQTDLRHPAPTLAGQPLSVEPVSFLPNFNYEGVLYRGQAVPNPTCLIVPTSLCSGQIASLAVRRLRNSHPQMEEKGLHFATLVHTEGCGVSSGSSEELYTRTLTGYIQHPHVRHCLLLEHGCEKTHNDFMHQALKDASIPTDHLGWASVQLDGGIARVLDKIDSWFSAQVAELASERFKVAKLGLGELRIGLASQGNLSPEGAVLLKSCGRAVANAGGIAVAVAGTEVACLFSQNGTAGPTLAYAQKAEIPGVHLMDCPTQHWVETLSGLGATGVDLVLVHVDNHPVQGHPLIPALLFTTSPMGLNTGSMDVDLVINRTDEFQQNLQLLFDAVGSVLSRQVQVKSMQTGNVDFQITRGPSGISL